MLDCHDILFQFYLKKVAKIKTLHIVRRKVKYLEIGFVNKTGSQIERENTHAKKRVIAAMEDLVIATIETRIIAKRIPVFMENRFARLNGSYHILKNTDAKNHAVYASRGIQMKRNIFITDIET